MHRTPAWRYPPRFISKVQFPPVVLIKAVSRPEPKLPRTLIKKQTLFFSVSSVPFTAKVALLFAFSAVNTPSDVYRIGPFRFVKDKLIVSAMAVIGANVIRKKTSILDVFICTTLPAHENTRIYTRLVFQNIAGLYTKNGGFADL
ncbi:MAG: hypothetical protein QNJ09_16900 [Paracoccaceae bacterium]|nr:hypothetical protein [Paracoccaceae bacterium]